MSEPNNSPTGTITPLEHERRYLAIAVELETKASVLLARDGRIDIATGNQLMVSALAARKEAAKLALDRLHIEHEREMARAARQLRGLK